MLTQEEFQEELVVLGLSGKEFGPEEYARELGLQLGIGVIVQVLPDVNYPELARRLARSGRLAETHYSPDHACAVVMLPSSLPPMLRAMTAYHELGHLAAGDHLLAAEHGTRAGSAAPSGKRLARRPPLPQERLREEEADLRASYAMLAGSLGAASPYFEGMYDLL